MQADRLVEVGFGYWEEGRDSDKKKEKNSWTLIKVWGCVGGGGGCNTGAPSWGAALVFLIQSSLAISRFTYCGYTIKVFFFFNVSNSVSRSFRYITGFYGI